MDGAQVRALAHRFARSPRLWLAVAVVAFAVLSFVLANVRLLEFNTTTWDFGIYQQSLWSASHGGPFYEAADWETGGFGSFLQVHSAFVLYLLAPLYGEFPSPELLFAVQSILVALAAVPLFLLTLDLTRSPRRALLAAVLFLVWAPTIAGSLYDFHIESFLPIELFTLALLFERQSYAAGFGVALLSFATMELAPALTLALGVFFAWPTVGQRSTLASAFAAGPRAIAAAGRAALRDRRISASLLLAVVSGAAYEVLLQLRIHYLAALFGFPAFPTASSGYVIGATPSSLGLALSNLPVGFLTKVQVWLLLYVLVGFLPLLVPRSFVLTAPMAAFAFLSSNLNYSSIGFQYGFLFAIPVFVGVAYALPKVTPANFPLLFPHQAPAPESPRRRWRVVASRPPTWSAAVLLVIGLNLIVGPLDPMLHGGNGFGSGYRLTYEIPPGYADVVQVAELIPAHATVIATDDLFPLVANSLTSYSFVWTAGDFSLNLPFSPSQLPDAVLVAQNRYYTVTPWLAELLYNPSDFGARAVAWSSPAGVVVLYLAHYAGPVSTFGPVPASNATFGPGPMAPGSVATVGPATMGPYQTEIESEPLNEGLVASGPWVDLSPGRYEFTLGLHAWAADPASVPAPGHSVAFVNGDAFGTREFLAQYIPYGNVSHAGWQSLTFEVNATGPLFNVSVRIYSDSMVAVVAVGFLQIAAIG